MDNGSLLQQYSLLHWVRSLEHGPYDSYDRTIRVGVLLDIGERQHEHLTQHCKQGPKHLTTRSAAASPNVAGCCLFRFREHALTIRRERRRCTQRIPSYLYRASDFVTRDELSRSGLAPLARQSKAFA